MEAEGLSARTQLPDNPLVAERWRNAANEYDRELCKCKTGRFHFSTFR